MLTQEVTPQMAESWKAVWTKYKDRLTPNRKSGSELAQYLKQKYPATEFHDEAATRTVTENVLLNRPFAEKLPKGTMPSAVTFTIENKGAGKPLHENQDDIFSGIEIFVGIDLVSGYFCVEGSRMLWDELCAFQGLDEDDIQNYYCVAAYISCLNKLGLLETALN